MESLLSNPVYKFFAKGGNWLGGFYAKRPAASANILIPSCGIISLSLIGLFGYYNLTIAIPLVLVFLAPFLGMLYVIADYNKRKDLPIISVLLPLTPYVPIGALIVFFGLAYAWKISLGQPWLHPWLDLLCGVMFLGLGVINAFGVRDLYVLRNKQPGKPKDATPLKLDRSQVQAESQPKPVPTDSTVPASTSSVPDETTIKGTKATVVRARDSIRGPH